MEKHAEAYRTISEAAEALDIPPHVLRFWESKFTQIKPLKRGGGRRYYRPADMDLLQSIRRLLYEDAYTIRGVQRLLKTRGAAAIAAPPGDATPVVEPDSGPHLGPECLAGHPVSRLVAALAAEIEACRTLVAEGLPGGPRPTTDPRPTPPPPAATGADAPPSTVPPP